MAWGHSPFPEGEGSHHFVSLWHQQSKLAGNAELQADSAALQGFLQQYQQQTGTQIGAAAAAEFRDLLKNGDAETMRFEAVAWGRKREAEGHPELAGAIWQQIAKTGDPVQASDAVRAAQSELERLGGGGNFGGKMELFVSHFASQACDPYAVLGFTVAGVVYHGTRLAMLSRLARPGSAWLARSAPWLASAAGLTAEASTLVLATKGARALSGQTQDWNHLPEEILASGLTLGMLKSSGAIFQAGAARLRVPPGFNQAKLQAAAGQFGMLAGIALSHQVEARFKLRPDAKSFSDGLSDTLFTWLQFNVGNQVAQRFTPTAWRQLQVELQVRAAERTNNIRPGGLPWQASLAAANGNAESIPSLFSGRNRDLIKGATILMSKMDKDQPNNVFSLNGKLANPLEASGAPPAEPPSPETVQLEIADLLTQSDRALAVFHRQGESLESRLKILLGHHALGRGKMMDVRRAEIALGHQFGQVALLQTEIVELHTRLQSLTFLSREPALREKMKKAMANLHDVRAVSDRVEAMQGRVVELLEASTVTGLMKTMQDWQRIRNRSRGRDSNPPPATIRTVEDEIFLEHARGMLASLAVKESYRPGHEQAYAMTSQGRTPALAAGSARASETEWLSRLLYLLDSREPEENYRELLLTAFADMPSALIRQGLGESGNFQEPFRGWLSVYLPLLSAVHNADVERMQTHLQPVLVHMDPELRSATALMGWWLAKALRGIGDPSAWPRQFLAEAMDPDARRIQERVIAWLQGDPLTAETAAEIAGEGALGAVALAIHHFLQAPFDERVPLVLALQAPESIREDTVSLTAALLGAFHGDGYFDSDYLTRNAYSHATSAMENAFTERRVEQLNRQGGALSNAKPLFLELWSRGRRPVATVTNLIPSSASGGKAIDRRLQIVFKMAKREATRGWKVVEELSQAGFRQGLDKTSANHYRQRLAEILERLLGHFQQIGGLPVEANDKIHAGLFKKWERVRQFHELLSGISLVTMRPMERQGATRWNAEEIQSLRQASLALCEVLGVEFNPDHWQPPARFGMEEIKKMYDGASIAGKSASPPQLIVPGFENRADWVYVQSIVKKLSETTGSLVAAGPPSLEVISEAYFEAIGLKLYRGPVATPAASVIPRLAKSAIVSVIVPAYLSLYREHPAAAYRDLAALRITPGSENRDIFRSLGFLSLRLLEGAAANHTLIMESEEFIGKTAMQEQLFGLQKVLLLAKSARENILRTWQQSDHPYHHVLLGMYCFFSNPDDVRRATDLAEQWSSPEDSERLTIRVAGLLAGAYRRTHEATSLADTLPPPPKPIRGSVDVANGNDDREPPQTPKRVEAFSSVIDPMFDLMAPESSPERVLEKVKAWAESRSLDWSESDEVALRENLNAFPDFFSDKWWLWEGSDPLGAISLLAGLGVLPEGSSLYRDPELIAALRATTSEMPEIEVQGIIWETKHVYERFGPLFFPRQYHDLSREEERDWDRKISELSPVFLKAMGEFGLMRPAMVLLLLDRLGIIHTGVPPFSVPPPKSTGQ